MNTLCWQILKCFLNNLINRSKLFSSPNSKPKCLTQTSDVGPGRAKKSVMDVCLCLSNSIENITLTQKFVTGQILKFWIHFCFLYERSNEKITSEINFFFRWTKTRRYSNWATFKATQNIYRFVQFASHHWAELFSNVFVGVFFIFTHILKIIKKKRRKEWKR